MSFTGRGVRFAAATACTAVGLSAIWTARTDPVNPGPPASASARRTLHSPEWISDRKRPALDCKVRTFAAASAAGETVAVKAEDGKDLSTKKRTHLRKRERRFQAFASREHDGQLFMTAQDFLESVTKQEPRGR